MPTRRGVLVAAAIVVLFLIANRAAYEGYFSGDDLDNILWTSKAGSAVFIRGLLTPLFSPDNFRPVGHAFFWMLGPVAGLRFVPWVAALQTLHLLVTLLIFLLARALGSSLQASAIGSLFFVFHMALFGAFWKPMYVFDVLCAMFCCLSVLAWRRMDARPRWWIASFICFWLAYKSKEVAVMLPAVLAVLDYASGARRWSRLLPFFGVSLTFGVQAMLNRPVGPYQLQLTSQTLAATISFYGQHVFLSSWGLVPLIAVLALARDRFGALAAVLLMAPMLALPGRMFAVYLYVPLAFLALTVASAAERSWKWAVPLLVLWLGVNFIEMRRLRSVALAEARDAREYVETLFQNHGQLADATKVRFDGYPPQLNSWGAEAAAGLISFASDGNTRGTLTLSWQPREHKLYLFGDGTVAYLDMSIGTPIHDSETGWYPPEANYRWTGPVAQLRLMRPAGATAFEWKIQVPPAQLSSAGGTIAVETLLDGKALPVIKLDAPGWKTVQTMDLPSTGEIVNIELRVAPPFRPPGDGRELGIAVGAIGFR